MTNSGESLASQPAGQPDEPVFLPAQSRRQAFDWSLVLASQDIVGTILSPKEAGHWGVLIEPDHEQRAREALRLYALENKSSRWQAPLPWPGMIFHWGSVWWGAAMALAGLAAFRIPSLSMAGRMDGAAFWQGEWWRLVTAMTLHGSLSHLVSNLVCGLVFIGLVMARFRPGLTLVAGILAGVAGNVTGLFVYDPPYRSLGASGMVMGAVGMLGAHFVALWRKHPRFSRQVTSCFCAGLLLFVLFGTDPDSDVVNHAGGFAAGLLLGALLGAIPSKWLDCKWLNTALVLLSIAIVLTAWGFAITQLPKS